MLLEYKIMNNQNNRMDMMIGLSASPGLNLRFARAEWIEKSSISEMKRHKSIKHPQLQKFFKVQTLSQASTHIVFELSSLLGMKLHSKLKGQLLHVQNHSRLTTNSYILQADTYCLVLDLFTYNYIQIFFTLETADTLVVTDIDGTTSSLIKEPAHQSPPSITPPRNTHETQPTYEYSSEPPESNHAPHIDPQPTAAELSEEEEQK